MDFYDNNAKILFKQYESVKFESVHQDWLTIIPKSGKALDLGCGSGRDAAYLAAKGFEVVAVDKSVILLDLAKNVHISKSISWFNDFLPNLPIVMQLNIRFDLVLLSAVWMHLNKEQRAISLRCISELLSSTGIVVITLRHGLFDDSRTSYPLTAEEIMMLGESEGLSSKLVTELSNDQLGRDKVVWQTVVLRK